MEVALADSQGFHTFFFLLQGSTVKTNSKYAFYKNSFKWENNPTLNERN
uniref:Uncharacterized protein n=1 Tax=Anguilla anguilla TaxID=7936 RepID=A0A0E9SRA4_ANGAN